MAFGKWHLANGIWQMASGKWHLANGIWQMVHRFGKQCTGLVTGAQILAQKSSLMMWQILEQNFGESEWRIFFSESCVPVTFLRLEQSLVKSTPGVNFINVFRVLFFVRMPFRQLFSTYVRKKAAETTFVRKKRAKNVDEIDG